MYTYTLKDICMYETRFYSSYAMLCAILKQLLILCPTFQLKVKQTDGQTDEAADRQTDKETERRNDGWVDGWANCWAEGRTNSHAN